MNAKKREDIQQAPKRPWELVLELAKNIPDEELESLPRDLAHQHDHYLYGVPKKEQ